MARARFAIVGLVLGAASPAAAQQTQLELDALRAQQQAAQQRAIAQSNELMALEAQLRADRAVADLLAQRNPPRLPELPYPDATPGAPAAAGSIPSIPDALLADSNRRVQAAARNRR